MPGLQPQIPACSGARGDTSPALGPAPCTCLLEAVSLHRRVRDRFWRVARFCVPVRCPGAVLWGLGFSDALGKLPPFPKEPGRVVSARWPWKPKILSSHSSFPIHPIRVVGAAARTPHGAGSPPPPVGGKGPTGLGTDPIPLHHRCFISALSPRHRCQTKRLDGPD